jgi:hypothetical protein
VTTFTPVHPRVLSFFRKRRSASGWYVDRLVDRAITNFRGSVVTVTVDSVVFGLSGCAYEYGEATWRRR